MDLKFMMWNAHSVRNKFHELANFIQSNNIDIAFISESWLEDKNSFYLPNFNIYRADRNKGGALIIIRSDIEHNSLVRTQFSYAEAVSIKVLLNNNYITLTSAYISPAATRKQSESFFSKLLSMAGQHFIAGDFNCRHQAWNNTINSHKGIDLFNLAKSHQFEILVPDKPTHVAYHGDLSTIDFALNKSSQQWSDLITVNELSSDHLPVCFSLNSYIQSPAHNFNFNFAKAKWRNLRHFVNNEIRNGSFSTDSHSEIDETVESMNTIIIEGMHKYIPIRSKPSHLRNKFSSNVQNLIKHRNHFRKLYQRTLDSAHKSAFNQLNRMIKRAITTERQNDYKTKLGNLTFKDNSLFRQCKSLKSKKCYIPPLTSSNNTAYSDKDKADLLAESFKSVHEISTNATSQFESLVSESVDQVNASSFTVQDNVSEQEVLSIISSLNPKKAAGFDSIPNSVLKSLCSCDYFIKLITMVFNSCLNQSYFPTQWKLAKIVSIPKSNPASQSPSDYRPISLLPVIGKVFERIILTRLSAFEEDNKIFIKQQFGFKSKHSTTQQILRITEKASLAFNHNKSLGLVLLDLRKAYDSVWHNGLIHKMNKLKYPSYLIKLIISFLKDRKAFVSVNKSHSFIFRILAGVPQGSVMAPHLFNLFINDIPIPSDGELALFADDTAYFIEADSAKFSFIKHKLVSGLKAFKSFFQNWKIFLNDNKTEFIIFTRSTKMIQKFQNDQIVLDNISLTWKSHVRYLGVYLDTKLLFKHHINVVLSKAKSIAYSPLYSLLKRNSGVSIDSKIRIYKAIIRPIIAYACPIFINCAKTNFKKLETFQNKLLRQILGIKWDDFVSNDKVHAEAKTPTFREFALKLTNRFYTSCDSHTNDLISNLGQYNYDSLDFHVKHRLPKPSVM